MASYTKTNWVNGETPINEMNLNKIENALESLFNMVYPVGSIYMSVNSANPSTLFGGTWVAWGSGKVPVGVDTTDTNFDTVEETGGNKTDDLSNAYAKIVVGSNGYIYSQRRINVSSWAYDHNASPSALSETGSTSNATNLGGTVSTLQPYITCYMWKRTA